MLSPVMSVKDIELPGEALLRRFDRPGPRYTSYPTADRFVEAFDAAAFAARLASRGDAFTTLARSIVGQQISVKAADAVWTRLSAACPQMTPVAVLRRRA